MSILQNDQNGEAIQGFAPNRVESITAGGSLDVTGVLAIRTSIDGGYQINGVGTSGTMPAAVTVIRKGITSLKFANATVVEVMD